MKTIVACRSRTGHAERVTKETAAHLSADLETICDQGIDRSGLWGYLRSGWQGFSGATPAIQRAARNPADCELVVIGTPVWNWGLAAPVHTDATRHVRQLTRVAFFCTEGGSGERRAFAELQRICRQPPLAAMAIKEDRLDPPRHAQALRRFIARLADGHLATSNS